MNGFGASGPLPHTRYLAGSGSISWSFNRTAIAGSPIKLAAGTAIADDERHRWRGQRGRTTARTGAHHSLLVIIVLACRETETEALDGESRCIELSRAGNVEA